MTTNLKKDQKIGVAKPQMPDVKAPITKPQTEKKAEAAKPTLEERI